MKARAVISVGSLIVLVILICLVVYKNGQRAGQQHGQADSEYRDSLTAQILADSDTIKYVQSKMRAGTMDPTNGLPVITNLLARDLKMEEMSAEFDRTNK